MTTTTYTITGTIAGTDGSKTEFLLHPQLGSWSQWGDATREQLAERVAFLDALAAGLSENSDYYQQPEDDEADADNDDDNEEQD